MGKMTQRSRKFNQCYHRGVMTSYSNQLKPTDRLYVEQYHLIQELYGGTGIVGVTDDVRVRDDAGVTNVVGGTDFVTDIAGVTDTAGFTDIAGVTGGTVRHMAYRWHPLINGPRPDS